MAYIAPSVRATAHAHSYAEHSNLSPDLTATALVGAALIPFRVNERPEQRAHLRGLVEMAVALGALTPSEHAALLVELSASPVREVNHV